jgi:two-component system, chemotaxis family, CheB/CheR fusion protein
MALTSEAIESVLETVVRLGGSDFRDYRPETIRRGIEARLAARTEVTVTDYARTLEQDQDELRLLLEALVVPWSSFFRDPLVFSALEDEVLPRLALEHLERRPLRAWCVGTATGEEAWSLAMLLGTMGALPAAPSWELLASDLDERTLRVATLGRYPGDSLNHIPPRHRHFLEVDVTGETARVAPGLRRRVHFARHDMLGARLAPAAAIVASFDLVMVRNVLIYFDRRLQEKALARVAATLEPGGVLVLGQVENLPQGLRERFESYPGLDPDLRIFRARAG